MQGPQYNQMAMSQAGMNQNVGNMGMSGMHTMGNMPMSATPDPNVNLNGMNNSFGAQSVGQPHVSMQGTPGLPDDPSQLTLAMMQHGQPQQQTQGQHGVPQQSGLPPNLHQQAMDANFFAAQQQIHQQQLAHLRQGGNTPINGPPPAGLGDFGGLDMDLETRKRKMEEEEDIKRTRQKTGKIDACFYTCIPTKAHVLESCIIGEPPDVPVCYVSRFYFTNSSLKKNFITDTD